MVGDQSPVKNSLKYWTRFLNQETAFLQGASTIARKTNHVVIFSYFSKKRRGYYELNFKLLEKESIEKSDYEIIAKYAKSLETAIESSPELWLWSHKRWKLSRD
jgi:KDO2-lipid IV(A) lauroyltransferase